MPFSGDPTWLADVLRAEGVRVVEWRERDRTGAEYDWRQIGHGDFGDVWGVLWHHMGVNDQGADIIRHGVPGLAGPIANIHLARNGTATVVAAGVAWHAGNGSWPGLPTNNANPRLIGVEMAGNGTDPWPPECWDAAVRIGAAISRRLGYGADRNIAHKEWAGRAQGKWDPGNWDMDAFRRDIHNRLTKPAAQPNTGVPNMADLPGLSNAEARELLTKTREVWDQLRGIDGKGWPQLGTNAKGENLSLVDALAEVKSKVEGA
ncbi:N-acetylmuramoyl-L-alanine amidase [Rhodococcus ruber]|uniref:N-acetylmuramoyl-L-alanine amidase n=1 Tax=Rhodococcus ruber TaxID=1830 RepID=UPI0037844BE8